MTRRALPILLMIACLAAGCAFDTSLREYLDARFWLPFAKQTPTFERRNVRRVDEAFAGMTRDKPETPIGRLRTAYQQISTPMEGPFASEELNRLLADARADRSLTRREREEVDLIDAKIDLRRSEESNQEAILGEALLSARAKLEKFLRVARTPEFRSEARGWLGRVFYLLGDQAAAGKIYLDELNRNGSNLSRVSLLNSLRLTYGYDGGPELRKQLPDYFDTPQHAVFAIELATNPRWDRYEDVADQRLADAAAAAQYHAIRNLLNRHADLFQSHGDSSQLTLLTMRTALRMGDPAEAVRLAQLPPADSPVRENPDFLWMDASAGFLSRDYAAAESPLLRLFQSHRATGYQRHAAAYALCGVYFKTGNRVEQIRYALWLRPMHLPARSQDEDGEQIDYPSIYWDESGWDFNLLMESQASIEDLQAFLAKYANVDGNRLLRYALAVRLARDNRYPEAADIYDSIHAYRRAPRMRKLAALYGESQRTDLSAEESEDAQYRLAEYIAANPNRLYFNDSLWGGFQRYALTAGEDSGFTREEREAEMEQERRLKDDQEERWRAWLILRDVIHDTGKSPLGRKAARLALDDLGRISDRFGRKREIDEARKELTLFLR